MSYSLVSKYRKALMGVSALLIYYFHVGAPVLQQYHELLRLQFYVHAQSFIGVDVFVFLSAFGLAYSFSKGSFSWRKYLLRRFMRLYPCYLVADLAYTIVFQKGWGFFLKSAVFYSQVFENVYSLLWYVFAAVVFYLVAPVYYFGLLKRVRNKMALTAGCIALSIAVAFAMRGVLRPDLYAILTRVPVFLMGFLCAEWAQNGKICGWKKSLGWILLMMVGLFANAMYNTKRLPEIIPAIDALINFTIVPGMLVVLLAIFEFLTNRAGKTGKVLMSIPLFMGGISYEFYCVHELICHMLRNAGESRILPSIPIFFSCLVFSICAALVLKGCFVAIPARLHKKGSQQAGV